MHIDINEIFAGILMVSLLHLPQFSHVAFEECHSELCDVFSISRKSISFMKLIFSFDTSTKREAAIEKLSSRYNLLHRHVEGITLGSSC